MKLGFLCGLTQVLTYALLQEEAAEKTDAGLRAALAG
jgi:hypothetical protein